MLTLILFVFFVSVAASILPGTNLPGGDDEKPEWKNLKVLPKDISEHKLDSIMGTFSVSLGVKCNFCHASDADTTKHHLDFASDKKEEKDIARAMFKMTADINSNYFNWTHSTQTDTLHSVVCYTCHRGTKQPDASVFIATIDSTIQSNRKNRK